MDYTQSDISFFIAEQSFRENDNGLTIAPFVEGEGENRQVRIFIFDIMKHSVI